MVGTELFFALTDQSPLVSASGLDGLAPKLMLADQA